MGGQLKEVSEEKKPEAAAVAADRTAGRFGFIDLLRGFALVVMIETHVINAYLPMSLRHTWFFFWLTFFNGLVAPTFLFASGFSLMLQGRKQWSNWLGFNIQFWKQMRRLGFILLVAYYSHLQHFALSRYLGEQDPAIWKTTLQVDILQCIGVSLLIIHLLIFILRKPAITAWSAMVLAIGVAMFTPLVWSHDFTPQLPLALALFLNPHGISLFPLFPWMSFIFCGVFVSQRFTRAWEGGCDRPFMVKTALAGGVMILAGLMGTRIPWSLPGQGNYFTTSPLYVLIRLGCVLIFCSSWYALEKYRRFAPSSIRLAGQESLLVYGVHLWVIFAFLRGRHLGPILGLEMGYLMCFLVSAAIILFMLWLARKWNGWKKNYPSRIKRGQFVVVMLMIIIFLLR